jgi:glycosyltransferase involved in cell wall biosynthesis
MPQRICLIGNMANNAYTLCKTLRKHGLQAHLLLNPADTHILSHPIWEEVDIVLDPATFEAGTTTEFWKKKSEEIGWKAPDWIRTAPPDGRVSGFLSHPKLAYTAARRVGLSETRLRYAARKLPVTSILSDFDFVGAYGREIILANLSGVEYAAIPYGADVTIVPFGDDFFAGLQRDAYAAAKKILVGDHNFSAALTRLGISNYAYFPYPVDVEHYRPASSPISTSFTFLMPSRHDFYWKRSDLAIKAFARLARERDDVILVTLGLGDDMVRSLQLVKELRCEQKVRHLPYAFSKPRLIGLYQSADVVIDQFMIGAHGTTMLEAMACEKPVIINYDVTRFSTLVSEYPPVLQAKSEEEIYSQMRWAVNNPDEVKTLGRRARQWIIDNHTETSVRIFQNVMNDPS